VKALGRTGLDKARIDGKMFCRGGESRLNVLLQGRVLNGSY
jgi:hypothetical protein